jgi:hypothetical protein
LGCGLIASFSSTPKLPLLCNSKIVQSDGNFAHRPKRVPARDSPLLNAITAIRRRVTENSMLSSLFSCVPINSYHVALGSWNGCSFENIGGGEFRDMLCARQHQSIRFKMHKILVDAKAIRILLEPAMEEDTNTICLVHSSSKNRIPCSLKNSLYVTIAYRVFAVSFDQEIAQFKDSAEQRLVGLIHDNPIISLGSLRLFLMSSPSSIPSIFDVHSATSTRVVEEFAKQSISSFRCCLDNTELTLCRNALAQKKIGSNVIASGAAFVKLLCDPVLIRILHGIFPDGFHCTSYCQEEANSGWRVSYPYDGIQAPFAPNLILSVRVIWALEDFTNKNAPSFIPGTVPSAGDGKLMTAPCGTAIVMHGAMKYRQSVSSAAASCVVATFCPLFVEAKENIADLIRPHMSGLYVDHEGHVCCK